MTRIQYPLTVFYDASCPLCATEMHSLKQLDVHNRLILMDCSDSQFDAPASCPVTREAMMQRIYAQDAHGQWLSGIDVFAIAYGAAGFHRVSKILAYKRLKPLFERLYPLVANNRQWLSKTPLPSLLNKILRAPL